MNMLRLVCILLPLAAASCQPPASPSAATAPSNGKADSKNGKITVTIDGREATPEEAEGLGAFAKHLLSDAVRRAINEGLKELVKKLEISDPIEVELIFMPFDTGPSDGIELRSVYLIRPAKETKQPRTVVLSRDGKPVVRFTRAAAPVESPLAIINLTSMKDGHPTQTETFLVHSEGKWKQYRPSVHNESVK